MKVEVLVSSIRGEENRLYQRGIQDMPKSDFDAIKAHRPEAVKKHETSRKKSPARRKANPAKDV
jgi:hypothetical protein